MSKIHKFNMISDPGHGWLSVNMKHLIELNIVDQISPYSYFNKNCVYLEEDCDMSVFLKAARAAGWDFTIVEKYQEKTSIRSFPSYTKSNLAKSNNLKIGGLFYLFNKNNRRCDNMAKVVQIDGTKYFIQDECGFRYKTTFSYLIKNTTLDKEVDKSEQPELV